MSVAATTDVDFRNQKLRLQAKVEETEKKYEIVKENAARKLRSLQEKRQKMAQSRQEHKEQLRRQIAQLKADLPLKKEELEHNRETEFYEKQRQLEATLAQWAAETTSAKRNCAVLEQRLRTMQLEQAQRREQAKIDAKVRELQYGALSQSLQMDIHMCGPDSMLLMYKWVNPADPEEICSVQLEMDATGVFIVSCCEPELRNLDHLVNKLNKDRDFFTFLKNIRNAFLDHFIVNIR